MVTIVNTITVQALNAIATEVQISIFNGIPSFHIVGMVNKSVNEAAIRIKTAINSLGFELPPKKIVVNLSPTNIIKDGNYYDLPILVGILYELKVIKNIDLNKFIIIGEISLDARIKNVNVALIASIYAKFHNKNLICPYENGNIAALSSLDEILAPRNLLELIAHFNDNQNKKLFYPKPLVIKTKTEFEFDFSMINGSFELKRALEISAAGGHSLLIQGPPGCGKTFAAESMRSIMPELSTKEIIEILLIKNSSQKDLNSNFSQNIQASSLIQENNENFKEDFLEIERPFRNPHHSASIASIVGGGKMIEPGEVTFAHNGILFLDELPEFSSSVLDSLREPLEKKEINITRAERNVTYPANFQLITALNPCKCGYFGIKNKECNKVPFCAINYQKKISGPFLDRIDLFITIKNNQSKQVLYENYSNFSLSEIRDRINYASKIQKIRFKDFDFQTNSSAKSIKNFLDLCSIEKDSFKFINDLLNSGKINQRTYIKTISISRTIADLERNNDIKKDHILEALFFKKNMLFE